MKIIVGITGGSASIYGISVLGALKALNIETHLVISKMGKIILKQELDIDITSYTNLYDHLYDNDDLGARIASGSFKTDGMIISPCSMKTLAAINCGLSNNLITRAADVILKEKKKLLLVTRETPFNSIHLKNMFELSQNGCIIFPPITSFYNRPKTLEDSIVNTTGRILDLMDIKNSYAKRWEGLG